MKWYVSRPETWHQSESNTEEKMANTFQQLYF